MENSTEVEIYTVNLTEGKVDSAHPDVMRLLHGPDAVMTHYNNAWHYVGVLKNPAANNSRCLYITIDGIDGWLMVGGQFINIDMIEKISVLPTDRALLIASPNLYVEQIIVPHLPVPVLVAQEFETLYPLGDKLAEIIRKPGITSPVLIRMHALLGDFVSEAERAGGQESTDVDKLKNTYASFRELNNQIARQTAGNKGKQKAAFNVTFGAARGMKRYLQKIESATKQVFL